MKKLFMVLMLLCAPAFAVQKTADGSQSVVLASDHPPVFTSGEAPTVTHTPTYTSTPTYTPTGSATPIYTNTHTYTRTATFTPTNTLPYGTNTFTPVATRTPTPTYTATTVYTATGSATPTYTSTHTYTSTPTYTSTSVIGAPVGNKAFTSASSTTPTPITTAVALTYQNFKLYANNTGTATGTLSFIQNGQTFPVDIAPSGGMHYIELRDWIGGGGVSVSGPPQAGATINLWGYQENSKSYRRIFP